MSRIAAILPAAGLGTRMGADTPKQFLELNGTPIVILSVRRIAVEAGAGTRDRWRGCRSVHISQESVILSWQESSAVKRNSNSLRVQVSEFAEKGGASKPHFAGTFCSHCRSLGTKVALSV